MAQFGKMFSQQRTEPRMPAASQPPIARDERAEEVIRTMYDDQLRLSEALRRIEDLEYDLQTERDARHAAERELSHLAEVNQRLQRANTRMMAHGDHIVMAVQELQSELTAQNMSKPLQEMPNFLPRRRVDLGKLEKHIGHERDTLAELAADIGREMDEHGVVETETEERP